MPFISESGCSHSPTLKGIYISPAGLCTARCYCIWKYHIHIIRPLLEFQLLLAAVVQVLKERRAHGRVKFLYLLLAGLEGVNPALLGCLA